MGLDFPSKIDYDDDFGFSEDNYQTLELERIGILKDLFLNLLEYLSKEPEADYIYWPNRKDAIEELIKIVQET